MSAETVHTARIGEQAGIVLFSQWDLFCRLREQALNHPALDTIHDLRVASRRLRATIGLFAPFVAEGKPRRIGKELQRVTRSLGRLRNLDEAQAYFSPFTTALPVLIREMAAARETELRRVSEELESFPRQKLDRLLRKGVEALSEIPGDAADLLEYLSTTAFRRFQTVHDLLPPAIDTENVAGRHALRIAIKKWRYLLETAGTVFRHDYTAPLELLKEYQTLLGALNDLEEFRGLIDEYDLPESERRVVMGHFEQDVADHLGRFLELSAARPPQYTFVIEVNRE